MAGISATDALISGLNASKVAIADLSNQMANVETPGFTAKKPLVTTRILDGLGAGVDLAPFQRVVDPFLVSADRVQASLTHHMTAKSNLMKQMELEFGKPGDANSISEMVRGMVDAYQKVSTSPTDPVGRKEVMRTSTRLFDEIARISGRIQQMRQDVDGKIATAVADVNNQLDQINSLNSVISGNTFARLSVGDLEDQRDLALKNLAQHLDVSVSKDGDNVVYIQNNAGVALLFPDVIHIDYTATALINASSAYNPNPALSSINPITVSDSGGNTTDITLDFKDGDIAAFLEMRDTVLPQLQQELDRFAASLRDSVNAAHNLGASQTPPDTLTGTHIFTDPTVDTYTGTGVVRFALVDKTTGQMVGGNTFDLDTTTMGTVSIQTLAANIQGGLTPLLGTVTAVCDATTNNQLVLNSGDPNIGIAITSVGANATETATGRGFSHFFGLNDLIISPPHGIQGATADPGISQTLAIRPDILATDAYLSRGTLSSAVPPPVPPAKLVALGDKTCIDNIIGALSTPQVFTAAGGLTSVSANFMDYAALIIADYSLDVQNVETRATQESNRLEARDYAIGQQAGVTVQDIFTQTMNWQRLFTSCAHMSKIVNDMFRELVRVV
ncbi:MAG: flagellar hook-associated protein FlgK [Proteobacteria bacterium]|nr:flagellar hook-associated protein FlgK [Pseudomonadota bacterium]